jgi:hypothetical protein
VGAARVAGGVVLDGALGDVDETAGDDPTDGGLVVLVDAELQAASNAVAGRASPATINAECLLIRIDRIRTSSGR